MNPTAHPKRPFGAGAYALLVAGALVLGGLAGAASVLLGDQPGPWGLIVTLAIIGAAMIGGFAACVWWWRGIDEAAREAHKWAWWWGGSAGMGVGGVLLLALHHRADTITLPSALGSDPADLFVSGMMAILAFQLIGYTLAWAGWWLKHR
jgi:hypothetical protein